jgi:NhaP-type Na+/H+ or K+/H+ antiporter
MIIAAEFGPGIFDIPAILYAVISLTVIRMVPVALSLIGVGFRPRTVAFVGWFGPRGLASIVFLIIALGELRDDGVGSVPLARVVAWTVFLSVVLHGISAYPLANRFGRFARALPPSAPELFEVPEPHNRRRSWARPVPAPAT